jgi:hypothetical protein
LWRKAEIERILNIDHVPPADGQVVGCHHPNIATKKHATIEIIWKAISIQYRTGVASL